MTSKLEKGPQPVENYSEKYKEGLERYKAVLLQYKLWIEEKSKDGTDNSPEMDRESKLKHAFIDGMAAALDLSTEDEIKIMNEIGFVKKDT